MSQSRDHRRDEMDKHRGMNRIASFITAVVFSVATMLFAIARRRAGPGDACHWFLLRDSRWSRK